MKTIFKEIVDCFNDISNTSKRKEKEEILSEFSDSTFMEDILILAHDPRINFYVDDLKDLPEPEGKSEHDNMFELLDDLHNRELTGNAAKQAISNFFEHRDADECILVECVLARKMAEGLGPSTINKVFPKLIYVAPYMRCGLLNAKSLNDLEFPLFSQLKLDGSFTNIIVQERTVIYMTRQGNIVDYGTVEHDTKLVQVRDHIGEDYVIQGEAVVLNEDGIIMERSEGNGYLNSDNADRSRIAFHIWDFLTFADFNKGSSDVTYGNRIVVTKKLVQEVDSPNLLFTDTRECHTIDEIIEHFKEVRSTGQEGTVVKNKKLIWKSHTSKDQLKLKVTAVADLVVTGWKEGKGKYAGMVGSIEMESSDGLVQVSVRCKTDAQTKLATKEIDNWIKDELVLPVIYNDIVESEQRDGIKSLYLPRFETDKLGEKRGRSSADSHDRIIEILDSFEFLF